MAEYTFRPLTRDDYPLFHIWLAEPHIAGWWGDAETELSLIEADFDSNVTDMYIVELDGHPFAYVQDYDAHHWPMPQYADLPPKARALDTFVGDPAYLGKGHASGYLAQRLADLRRHYPVVAVDPDPTNTRAIAAYARAGFRHDRVTPCEDGDLVQVMCNP
jgi:aminoglycoside 6'-N-acetyltransferase